MIDSKKIFALGMKALINSNHKTEKATKENKVIR